MVTRLGLLPAVHTRAFDFLFFLLFFIYPLSKSLSQEADLVAGKSLFNTNCAACHKLDKKMTGPALRHVEERLLNDEGLDREWLSAWIRNSAKVIKSGDAYANKIYAEYFKDNQPCRTTIEIKSLPTPIAIELKIIATI